MRLTGRDLAGLVLRTIVGVFWPYFGSQKWFSYEWVHPLIETASNRNPIPVYAALLREVILPNWRAVTLFSWTILLEKSGWIAFYRSDGLSYGSGKIDSEGN